jgi:predicted aldo/keto reductase-like oxidoreductase
MLKEFEPNRTIASWAMRWLMDLPQVAVVLSGMSDIDQVKDNIATFTEHEALSEEEKDVLQKACELFRPTVAAACTDCRYCIADCPKGLDIPRILNVFNEVKIGHMWRIALLGNLPEEQQPSNCIACNICMDRCPQDLDIPEYMAELIKRKNEA